MIILIFVPRRWASVLAYAHRHSVIGLTLPPIDANTFFIMAFSLSGVLEKKSLPSVDRLRRAEQEWLQRVVCQLVQNLTCCLRSKSPLYSGEEPIM